MIPSSASRAVLFDRPDNGAAVDHERLITNH